MYNRNAITEQPEGFVKDYSNAIMQGHMGRIGMDINGAVVFLASPASDCVTGATLYSTELLHLEASEQTIYSL